MEKTCISLTHFEIENNLLGTIFSQSYWVFEFSSISFHLAVFAKRKYVLR